MLIDSGPNPPDSLIILKAVKAAYVPADSVLINTETHNDHATGNFVFSPPVIVIGSGEQRHGIKRPLRPQAQRKVDGRIERNRAKRFVRFPRSCRRMWNSTTGMILKMGDRTLELIQAQEYPQ